MCSFALGRFRRGMPSLCSKRECTEASSQWRRRGVMDDWPLSEESWYPSRYNGSWCPSSGWRPELAHIPACRVSALLDPRGARGA
eukprot:1420454-Pleurochrysis_carterae.AAC.1